MTDAAIARPPARRLHVLLLVLLPAVLQAAAVTAFGSRMFLWDEFFYVRAFREIGEGRPWLYWIWAQHNEHRIVWTKILFFAHAGISGWNPIVDMYVSAALTALIAWGLWKLYRAAGGEHPAYFVPVSLLLCSLAQYMNILYGLMTCHYFTMAGMIWAIVFLQRRTWKALAAAIACACAALVSTLNAIVIAPIGLFVLVMTRQTPRRWIVWSAGLLGCLYAYFRRYHRPGQMVPVDWSAPAAILQAADTFLVNLGSPLSAFDVLWARALGVMTIGAIAWLWAGVWICRKRESHAGLVALSLVAVGCASAVAIGRSHTGGIPGLESKYVGYSTLALVGPYLGLVCLPSLRARNAIVGGLTTVIGVGLMAANMAGFERSRIWHGERQRGAYLLQTIETQPDESAAATFVVAPVAQIRLDAAYLRAARLGPYRDPMDALIAPRWQEGQPATITAATPVRAHLLCPVDTLVDVGLAVSRPPQRRTTGSLEVSVTAAGRVVGRARIDARDVQQFRYVRVDLEAPLRDCRGAELIVEATSEAADVVSAIDAWTYPAYYAGVTRQAGRPIDRRGLGLAFNAFSNGLVR